MAVNPHRLFERWHNIFLLLVIISLTVYCEDTNTNVISSNEDCQVTPVIHVLQYPGCVPKPIPSFACTGRCSSYLQVIFFAIINNHLCIFF